MPARRPSTIRPPLDVVTARILTPACLLFLLGLQIADGTAGALPVWLRSLALQADIDPIQVLRWLMATEIFFAGVMILLPKVARAVAFASLLTLCFSAIASISALPGDRAGVIVHSVVLLVAAFLLVCLRRTEPRPTLPAPLMVLSPQWRVLGLLAALVAAGAVAGRIDIRPAAVMPTSTTTTTRVVDFDLEGWLLMPISQIPLREHLPALTAKTLEGEHFVVFYSPTCGPCHDLFTTHFSGTLPIPVLAVRIPPPTDAILLPSDQPVQVDCPECEFLQLRPGPLYNIQPPVVFRVRDGVIRCIATSRDPGACLLE